MRDATDITVVLDRSGSMDNIKNDIIGGFNNFIREQRNVKNAGECVVTLIQFDSQNPQETLYTAMPVDNVRDLTNNTFVPRGGTPLYDAVGQAIKSAGHRLSQMNEYQRPDKVIFVIMTDGEENASQEFSSMSLFQLIGMQESLYRWHFIFIGANQDAIKAAGKMNIRAAQSITYAAAGPQVQAVYTSLGANIANLRTGQATNLDWTDDQRAAAIGNDAKATVTITSSTP